MNKKHPGAEHKNSTNNNSLHRPSKQGLDNWINKAARRIQQDATHNRVTTVILITFFLILLSLVSMKAAILWLVLGTFFVFQWESKIITTTLLLMITGAVLLFLTGQSELAKESLNIIASLFGITLFLHVFKLQRKPDDILSSHRDVTSDKISEQFPSLLKILQKSFDALFSPKVITTAAGVLVIFSLYSIFNALQPSYEVIQLATDQEEVNLTGDAPEGSVSIEINGEIIEGYIPNAPTWELLLSETEGSLMPGVNNFEIIAINERGDRSQPTFIDITYSPLIDPDTIRIDSIQKINDTSFSLNGYTSRDTVTLFINDAEVENYKTHGSTWSYLISQEKGDLQEGANIIAISAFDASDNIIDSREFILSLEEGGLKQEESEEDDLSSDELLDDALDEEFISELKEELRAEGLTEEEVEETIALILEDEEIDEEFEESENLESEEPELVEESTISKRDLEVTISRPLADRYLVEGRALPGTQRVQVNQLELKKFKPEEGRWKFMASELLGNLARGKNTYTIKLYDQNGALIYKENINIIH